MKKYNLSVEKDKEFKDLFINLNNFYLLNDNNVNEGNIISQKENFNKRHVMDIII